MALWSIKTDGAEVMQTDRGYARTRWLLLLEAEYRRVVHRLDFVMMIQLAACVNTFLVALTTAKKIITQNK